jgi:hypothetical protein
MNATRCLPILAAGLTALLFATGCLRRKETIQVSADGAVTMELEYRGKGQSWNTLDALPSKRTGWDLVESMEKRGNDEERVVRSSRRFAPGESLPENFAEQSDPDRDLYLTFPTTLTREKRGDAVYYHFRRVYAPRPWTYVQAWHDQAFEGDVKKLAEKKPEDMTPEDRARLMKAFADFEAMKQVEFARTAWRKVLPGVPQDHWLLARRALLDAYMEIDFDALADLFDHSEHQDERLNAEAERIVRRAFERWIESASRSGFNARLVGELRREYDRARKSYEITEQVGGHAFEITVQMPGRVVAHNADKTGEDGSVIWEFSGESFRDRPLEIMVTSVVDAGGVGE